MKTFKIIKILEIDGYTLHCLFSNQEIKRLDFQDIFKTWNISPTHIAYPLTQNLSKFKTVQLTDNSLSWPEIGINSKDENGNNVFYPYEIDPFVLYELGKPPVLSEFKRSLIDKIDYFQNEVLKFIVQQIATTPSQIKANLKIGYTTITRYLKQFKQANLVTCFKTGKHSFYSINFTELAKRETLA
jgi:hypothetical protein